MCRSIVIIFFIVSLNAADDIRYAAEAAYLPAGADITALGETGVVLPRRAISSYWNPASSSMMRQFELSLEGAELYSGLSRQACVTLHAPVKDNSGITLMYLPFYSGKIERYDSLPGTYQERIMVRDKSVFGRPKGYFRNNQHLVKCSIGRLFTLQLPRIPAYGLSLPLEISVGASVKGFWQMMDPDGQLRLSSGFNADLGVLSRVAIDYDLKRKEPNRHVIIAMSLHDLVPSKITWVNSATEYSEPFSLSQYYGLAYTDNSGFLSGNWTVAIALDKKIDVSYHAGIEAEYWDMVSFRIGISDRVPTIGAGVYYKRYFADYTLKFDRIDFSYIRLSVGVNF